MNFDVFMTCGRCGKKMPECVMTDCETQRKAEAEANEKLWKEQFEEHFTALWEEVDQLREKRGTSPLQDDIELLQFLRAEVASLGKQ